MRRNPPGACARGFTEGGYPGGSIREGFTEQGFTPLRPIYHRSTPAIAYSSSSSRIQRFSMCLQVLSRGLHPYELR